MLRPAVKAKLSFPNFSTAFPYFSTVIPAPYRHSRVSGNPGRYCQDRHTINQAFLDSRLRGNDGCGAAGRRPVLGRPF